MKRGFEHRLWGYKVVKTKQPDSERGTVSSHPSSVHSPLPRASLDDPESGGYGNLGTVESFVESGPAQGGEHFDLEKGHCSKFGNVEPPIRLVPESREGSEETEERDRTGEWQIPETVILTSESISPF